MGVLDDYLETLDEPARSALVRVRDLALVAVPEAEQGLSYGIAALRHEGRPLLGLLADACSRFGQSIAMVTHDPLAASAADRVVFLADGSVVDDRGRSSAEDISRFMLGMEAEA